MLGMAWMGKSRANWSWLQTGVGNNAWAIQGLMRGKTLGRREPVILPWNCCFSFLTD